MPSEDPYKQSKIYGKYLRFASDLGTLVISVALCTVGGFWLDGKAGTKPLFTIFGLALGFGAGFYSVYKTYKLLFPLSEGKRAGRDTDSKSGRGEIDGKKSGEDGA